MCNGVQVSSGITHTSNCLYAVKMLVFVAVACILMVEKGAVVEIDVKHTTIDCG